MQERIHEALRRNAVDEALALAQGWVAQAPDEAAAQRALAAALARAGDPGAALVALDQAILLAPEEAGLHYERAALLLRDRDPAGARVALGESLGLDPNHLPSYLAQAQIALAQGDLDEAERLIRTAARIDADDARLIALEAMLALRRGDAERALALASSASTQLRDDPSLLSVMAFAYLAKRHWAFAEQAFRRVAALLPDARALQPMLAQLAASQGRADEAADLVAPLVEDDATATPALRRIAGLYALQAGRGDEALRLLRRALATAPDRAVLQGLMHLWRERDDRDDARATLESALTIHRETGDLWAVRLALETPGTAESEQVLEQWLAAMPGDPAALEAAMLTRDRAGDLDGAVAFARQLLDVQPANIVAGQLFAESLLAHDPDAALERARVAVAAQASEDDRLAMRGWYGRLLDRTGRHEEAVAHWLALHAGAAGVRLQRPVLADAPAGPWPALAVPAPGSARPLLVWGPPGSGVERILDTLAAAGGPVRRDRYSAQAPVDPLASPQTAHVLRAGAGDPAALVGQWRAQLPARGIADGNIVDWLTWWDNALLLALRPHLPEGLLLAAVRDPRDMLLDWLARGAPVPLVLDTAAAAADWLAQQLEQLADLHEHDLYPHVLLRLDGVIDAPQALAQVIGQALRVQLPPPPPAPRNLAPGRWRAYAGVLAAPFARLAPVAARLGYPDV
ncbi:MAG: tetratricopeptide repeat protein [Pseudoxanthomonas sp.]|nr:tetratricopeptide repeat protein [Pseudoxanthomonas sp.]